MVAADEKVTTRVISALFLVNTVTALMRASPLENDNLLTSGVAGTTGDDDDNKLAAVAMTKLEGDSIELLKECQIESQGLLVYLCLLVYVVR